MQKIAYKNLEEMHNIAYNNFEEMTNVDWKLWRNICILREKYMMN